MSIGAHIVEYAEKFRPYVEHYGPLAVGLGIFGETFLFAGFFVTGFAALICAGFLGSQGSINQWAVLGAAFAGGVLGDQGAYLLGYFLGDRLLRRYERALSRLRRALVQDGGLILLWFHFLGPLRMVMPYIAGSLRFPRGRWLLMDTVGLALWLVFGYALGFFALGPLQRLGDWGYYVIFVILAGVVLYTIWRIVRLLTGADNAGDLIAAEAERAADAAEKGEAIEERIEHAHLPGPPR